MVLKLFDDEMRAHNFEARNKKVTEALATSRRLVESTRKVSQGRRLQFSPGLQKAWSKYPFFLSKLKIADEKQWEKFFEKQAAQKKQFIQENGPDAVQRILWRNLHQSIAFLTKHP